MPRGSSTIKQPLELSFGGPFTRGGAGKPPESDFTITISAQGHHGSLQVISAGGKGYITVSGHSYELPASSFKSVESGLGSLPSSGGTSGVKTDTSALGKLGIHPLDWLSDPKIVIAQLGHRRGRDHVDSRARLIRPRCCRTSASCSAKSGSLGIAGASSLPKSISATTQKRLAKALGSPTFDVWTGKSDKILRNLIVRATIPITGQTRTRARRHDLGSGHARIRIHRGQPAADDHGADLGRALQRLAVEGRCAPEGDRGSPT